MKNWSPVLLTLLITCSLSPSISLAQTSSAIVSSPKADTDLEKRAIELINAFKRKDYAQAHIFLTEPLRDYWTVEQLGKFWEKRILPEEGDVVRIIAKKQENIVNGYIVILRIQFTKGINTISITFNKQGEVVGYNFPQNKDIEEVAKLFVQDLFTNKLDSARGYLHPYLKIEIFPAKIKSKTESVVASMGAFQKVSSVDVVPLNANQDLAIVKTKFQKAERDIYVTFDKQKNIVGVDSTQN
ncbi:MAG: DUF3887 domain-containing protein [Cyanobacteriota bacterium ELA615]